MLAKITLRDQYDDNFEADLVCEISEELYSTLNNTDDSVAYEKAWTDLEAIIKSEAGKNRIHLPADWYISGLVEQTAQNWYDTEWTDLYDN